MLAYVQAAGASSGGPASAAREGPAAQDSIARMDPFAHVTDEEAKSYDKL